jgi:hypothetical protein
MVGPSPKASKRASLRGDRPLLYGPRHMSCYKYHKWKHC